MIYLALGDSISIDDYSGGAGGGAASQFAHLIGASDFRNLTRDGNMTAGVLASLEAVGLAAWSVYFWPSPVKLAMRCRG